MHKLTIWQMFYMLNAFFTFSMNFANYSQNKLKRFVVKDLSWTNKDFNRNLAFSSYIEPFKALNANLDNLITNAN
ncbi:hypothetical protein [Spiroplasma endosymbiont of Labia minor]|uniref:hypothetical protein n=1 Tax=Spiroplasma endosymbiont of Labia minor TaxID=3066305 RepID=UPI0030CAFE98